MNNTKKGRVDISELNTPPEKHEYDTAKYFAERGYDVVFVKPSNIKGQNSPDFEMGGKIWETKSPTGSSERVFDNNFRKAMKQSEHIIFDLRRMKKQNEVWCLNKINRQKSSCKIKTLLVITGDGRLLICKGKFDIIKA